MEIQGSNTFVNRQRIAKNTIIQYVQVLIKMVVGLITSRLVLQVLGASDYGLYNVVAGFILMFGFISSSMSITTTRFLNYEMGKTDGDVNRVFNISNVLHICTAIVFLLILETAGIIYILNYLNVESGKIPDAMFVFQVSTIIACIGIINVPYRSLFVAHEKFTIIATIEIISSLVNLTFIYFLTYYNGNALRLYALIMGLTTIIFFVAYHWLGYKKWPQIIKWKFVSSFSNYKEQLTFSNWNLLGTASFLGRSQGTHILINIFFSTLVNAAYAISKTVENFTNIFSMSFVKASAPQITKSISNGKVREAYALSAQINRYGIMLMLTIITPLIAEMDYILKIWLGPDLPEGAEIFCKITLLLALVSSSSCGLSSLITGLGNIKWFKISSSVIYVVCILIGLILYTYGLPAYTILIVNCVMDIIGRALQLYLLKRLFVFPVKQFVVSAWGSPACQLFFLFSVLLGLSYLKTSLYIHPLIIIAIMLFFSLLTSFYIGMTNKEREIAAKMIRNKFVL